MKITPIASEFIGILASVVKMYQGYIVYIGGSELPRSGGSDAGGLGGRSWRLGSDAGG